MVAYVYNSNTFRKLRQENCHKFEADLVYSVRHYLKNN